MDATILAALLVIMTGAQFTAQKRGSKRQRLSLLILIACELAVMGVLLLNKSFAESLAAWIVLAVFALANAGAAIVDLVRPAKRS